jgi:hypothetical protein
MVRGVQEDGHVRVSFTADCHVGVLKVALGAVGFGEGSPTNPRQSAIALPLQVRVTRTSLSLTVPKEAPTIGRISCCLPNAPCSAP